MKRYISFLFAGFLGLCFMSCEGPVGPPGDNGIDGADGTDGDAVCMQCHNTATKDAITAQWEESTHATGGHAARSSSNDCGKCHSYEGFIETQRTGEDTTAAGIELATQITCGACHSFHESLDFTAEKNYALRANEPIAFMKYPNAVTDFGNSSNLCANCHQTREAAPGDDAADEDWDQIAGTYTVGSSRFGPHHGPQGNLMAGVGGYKVSVDGSNNPHKAAGCATCHMHREGTDGKADHTFEPSINACKACHSTATSFDVNGYQTEMAALGAQLKTLLVDAGMLNASNNNAITGTYNIDEAGALFNYRSIFVEQPLSLGLHNPDYCKAMIEDAIATMSNKK